MKNNKFEAWAKTIAEKWNKRKGDLKDLYPFGPIKELVNEEGWRHDMDGPAYISPTRCTWYQEGRKHGIDITIFGSIHFYYEGIMVPPKYIQNPKGLTLNEILSHPNTEVRYVGIKIFGYDKLKSHKDVQFIHRDEETNYELYRCRLDSILDFGLVEVINSSPEMDGTYKKYYLQVPPDMKTCKEAVAWTFRMDAETYKPAVET